MRSVEIVNGIDFFDNKSWQDEISFKLMINLIIGLSTTQTYKDSSRAPNVINNYQTAQANSELKIDVAQRWLMTADRLAIGNVVIRIVITM